MTTSLLPKLLLLLLEVQAAAVQGPANRLLKYLPRPSKPPLGTLLRPSKAPLGALHLPDDEQPAFTLSWVEDTSNGKNGDVAEAMDATSLHQTGTEEQNLEDIRRKERKCSQGSFK